MAIIWVGTGRFSAYIGPVQDYIDRVVAADVAAGNTLGLEVGVRDAYDVFIRDSINVGDLGTSGGVLSQANSIIKAAPIMAGARTLAGALVPLVGTAPTNINFVAGDYDRKTGLVGNGSTKYLDSNRAGNADPQNSFHLAAYATTTGGNAHIASGVGTAGGSRLSSVFMHNRVNFLDAAPHTEVVPFFEGISRPASTGYGWRIKNATGTFVRASETPATPSFFIFANNTGAGANTFSAPRLAFYSIGEALNLALLDARITTLINTFGAVIP